MVHNTTCANLSRAPFRFSSAVAFLCALKHAPEIIQKFTGDWELFKKVRDNGIYIGLIGSEELWKPSVRLVIVYIRTLNDPSSIFLLVSLSCPSSCPSYSVRIKIRIF